MLSDDQIKARDCLRAGSWLINPAYQADQHGMEAKLKERCRLCWGMREHFPSWVLEYVRRWSKDSSE